MILPSHLKPSFSIVSTVKQLKTNQEHQKSYNDRHTRKLCDLQQNDAVWFQKFSGTKWSKGTIIEADNEHRSYKIRAENSKCFVRNRVFIRLNKSSRKHTQSSKSNVENYYINNNFDLDSSIYFETEDKSQHFERSMSGGTFIRER